MSSVQVDTARARRSWRIHDDTSRKAIIGGLWLQAASNCPLQAFTEARLNRCNIEALPVPHCLQGKDFRDSPNPTVQLEDRDKLCQKMYQLRQIKPNDIIGVMRVRGLLQASPPCALPASVASPCQPARAWPAHACKLNKMVTFAFDHKLTCHHSILLLRCPTEIFSH